jgi:hypothetical protein
MKVPSFRHHQNLLPESPDNYDFGLDRRRAAFG